VQGLKSTEYFNATRQRSGAEVEINRGLFRSRSGSGYLQTGGLDRHFVTAPTPT
jgi:hypothetical protein